jgi:hypothetical protein
MIAQTLSKITPSRNILEMLISAVFSPTKPSPYSPADFGCEIEEAELAEELAAQISVNSNDQSPQIEPEEFETVYNWFIS